MPDEELLRRFGGNTLGSQSSPWVPPTLPSDNAASDGINPPENFVEHLKRIGADNMLRIVDVLLDGGTKPTLCAVIPWEALQEAEYGYLASGKWKGQQ